ncbi:MAG: transglycosylase domain-containing protein [Clostridia bacterium]|nr:transglycosylase domain-containing protein [Clostridia bacterium]
MISKIIKACFYIVFALVLVIGIAIVGVVIYSRKNIDFTADEALFINASTDKTIRFYYDANLNADLVGYDPVLYCETNMSKGGCEWCSYEDFSPYLKEGFVAVEDRGFFSHHGIDVKRTVAAAFNYIVRKSKNFGGSTITQQVIKNISGDSEKTVKRKVDEIIRAYHIESVRSKEEIFELYLNVIPMSNNIVGVGKAAEVFFGKDVSELNAAEAATIIAIANAPSRYNPYKNGESCKKKRDVVLSVMYENGIIDENTYLKSVDSKICVNDIKLSDNSTSWYSETVLSELIMDLMNKRGYSYEAAKLFVYTKGINIYTAVDPVVQKTLEAYFENSDNFPKECKNGLEYSMVICDADHNLLRGIVGSVGKKSFCGGYNLATSMHTPGSALKPISLYLPLIADKTITWSTVFDDAPVTFSKKENGEWREFPLNSNKKYDGLTTVADALKNSKNTVAVRLYNLLGSDRIYNNLTDNFGIESLVYSEASENGILTDLAPSPLALGQLTKGVSLRDLTAAYGVFSGEGVLKKSRSYIAVLDGVGNLIIENESKEKTVCTREAARIMTQMLTTVVESGTASKITLKNIYDTAGKTGTSGADKDRLFIGYTPYYTAGIWCGYKDGKSAVGNHAKNNLLVWDEVMKEIHEKTVARTDAVRAFSTEGLLYKPFCKDSGDVFSEACGYDVRGDRLSYGYFIRGTEPSRECGRHVVVYEDMFPLISKISLLRIEERLFPKDIVIGDEKYAYRERRFKVK